MCQHRPGGNGKAVQLPEGLRRRRHGRVQLARQAAVGGEQADIRAGFLGESFGNGLASLAIAADEGHFSAVLGQFARGGMAHAAGAADDDEGFSGNAQIHEFSP